MVIALRRKDIIGEDLDDIAGLVHKSPGYAVLMLIFLLSLAGIPPTAGFLGKYYIFLALIETRHYTLAVIGDAVRRRWPFTITSDRAQHVHRSEASAPSRSLAQLRPARRARGSPALLTLGIGHLPGAVPAAGAESFAR